MVGRGENKKSMAYIGNIVAFLETCIASDRKYGLFNYVDTPDFTMNELVSQVRHTLKGKNGVGPRLPYWLGMILGYVADGVAKLTGKNLPVSSIRLQCWIELSTYKSYPSRIKWNLNVEINMKKNS